MSNCCLNDQNKPGYVAEKAELSTGEYLHVSLVAKSLIGKTEQKKFHSFSPALADTLVRAGTWSGIRFQLPSFPTSLHGSAHAFTRQHRTRKSRPPQRILGL
ncbi:uncharacterized [Tachysurus ichikawai]